MEFHKPVPMAPEVWERRLRGELLQFLHLRASEVCFFFRPPPAEEFRAKPGQNRYREFCDEGGSLFLTLFPRGIGCWLPEPSAAGPCAFSAGGMGQGGSVAAQAKVGQDLCSAHQNRCPGLLTSPPVPALHMTVTALKISFSLLPFRPMMQWLTSSSASTWELKVNSFS